MMNPITQPEDPHDSDAVEIAFLRRENIQNGQTIQRILNSVFPQPGDRIFPKDETSVYQDD